MKPVLTPKQMADADRRAIEQGTPESVLVERAGAAVASQAVRMLGGVYARRVVIVSGSGNNGADGVVAARRLRARGVGVDLFATRVGVERRSLARAVARADLAIDAMFGTGFHAALDDDAVEVARAFAPLRTLAVDIPSGVDGTTGEVHGSAVRAEVTVCFAALKPGLLFEPGRSHAGRVHVVDIGIGLPPQSPSLHTYERDDLFLPARPADANKW